MKKTAIAWVIRTVLLGLILVGVWLAFDCYVASEYRSPSGIHLAVRRQSSCCFRMSIDLLSVPPFFRMYQFSSVSACIGNLRHLDGAKEQCAMEKNLDAGAVVTAADLDPYIKGGTATVKCPCDPQKSFATSYRIEPLGTSPRCKIHPERHTIQ